MKKFTLTLAIISTLALFQGSCARNSATKEEVVENDIDSLELDPIIQLELLHGDC